MASLRLWVAGGDRISLPVCMGIPGRPGLVKIAMRDQWLREAARHLDGGPWDRARALRRAAKRFEAGKWQFWKNSPSPPPESTHMEQALHLALRSGARLPSSDQQYSNILNGKTKSAGNLGEEARS